jgi:copper chaperone CopZ
MVRLLLIALLTLPVAACEAGGGASEAAATRTVTVDVEGMTCNACEEAIKKAVTRVPGVKSCKASHTGKVAVIEIANDQLSDDVLVSTIVGLGYEAKLR